MVSTCFIVDLERRKFLLLFHPKHKKWLPPGGHLEEGETPHEAAERETKEETGLSIRFLLQENVWITESHAKSLPRPFLCLLEQVPQWQDQPAHEHLDFIYLAEPSGGTLFEGTWFLPEEISSLPLFSDTPTIIRAILDHLKLAETSST